MLVGLLAAEPHTPSVGPDAPVEVSHITSLPPAPPSQAHAHGPEPLPLVSVTAEALPPEHRFVVGALVASVPLAEPHTPLPEAGFAAHCSTVPPFNPSQAQLHGPEPLTTDAVPALHRLPPEGATLVVAPFAAPHAPLTGAGVSCAEHDAVLPPFVPAQLQLHGPEPLTPDAAPTMHRALPEGAVLTVVPPAEPHTPLAGGEDRSEAWHGAVAPPFDPAQLQLHGPEPLTEDAVPALHRLLPGAAVSSAPFEEPQAPLTATGSGFAEQGAVVPPFDPAQLHVHGPLPLSCDTVPALHRLVAGIAFAVVPLALPHTPLTAGKETSEAWHGAELPPFDPAQLQLHGPEPLTEDAVPASHRLLPGAALSCAPFEGPQTPFTAMISGAVQEIELPPFDPMQLQLHAVPLVTGNEELPNAHRLPEGIWAELTPPALPQAPLTGVTVATVVPPLLDVVEPLPLDVVEPPPELVDPLPAVLPEPLVELPLLDVIEPPPDAVEPPLLDVVEPPPLDVVEPPLLDVVEPPPELVEPLPVVLPEPPPLDVVEPLLDVVEPPPDVVEPRGLTVSCARPLATTWPLRFFTSATIW